ncbi:N-alpha-acetyltransferase 25, NatB auxiliary subunit, partial [Irineochytrium annulatum]
MDVKCLRDLAKEKTLQLSKEICESAREMGDSRVNAVLTQIENFNYKQALVLANKALKKQNDSATAPLKVKIVRFGHRKSDVFVVKALKAYSLDRLGRLDEALAVCQEVTKVGTTDDIALQAMSRVLGRAGKYSDIATLYENALKQYPANEEFANHWFMSLVKVDDYKRLQQVGR